MSIGEGIGEFLTLTTVVLLSLIALAGVPMGVGLLLLAFAIGVGAERLLRDRKRHYRPLPGSRDVMALQSDLDRAAGHRRELVESLAHSVPAVVVTGVTLTLLGVFGPTWPLSSTAPLVGLSVASWIVPAARLRRYLRARRLESDALDELEALDPGHPALGESTAGAP